MPAACCSTPKASSSCNGSSKEESTSTYEVVQDYYGKVLSTTKDLKTSACTTSGRPHARIVKLMRKIPKEVTEKFYGCGAPLPLGIHGLRVLDLGSGSGRDAYVCAALVGEHGLVTGIDMTEEQIQVSFEWIKTQTRTPCCPDRQILSALYVCIGLLLCRFRSNMLMHTARPWAIAKQTCTLSRATSSTLTRQALLMSQ